MILRGCCSSASIFGFFIRGSCVMIRLTGSRSHLFI
jgi:hypothetical protein